jgi:hypothetical protein
MTRVLPWDTGYNSKSNPVPPGVHIPWNSNVHVSGPNGPAVVPNATGTGTTVVLDNLWPDGGLEGAVVAAAEKAAKDALPAIEKSLQDVVVREIAKASAAVPEVTDQPTFDISVLLKRGAARAAALKSLAYGLFLALIAGVGTGVSAAAGLDWGTKAGAIAAGGLVVSSVLHSIMTYFGQLKWTSPPTTPEPTP